MMAFWPRKKKKSCQQSMAPTQFMMEVIDMFQKPFFRIIFALALALTLTSSTGLIADTFGLAMTSPAAACSTGSTAGGDC